MSAEAKAENTFSWQGTKTPQELKDFEPEEDEPLFDLAKKYGDAFAYRLFDEASHQEDGNLYIKKEDAKELAERTTHQVEYRPVTPFQSGLIAGIGSPPLAFFSIRRMLEGDFTTAPALVCSVGILGAAAYMYREGKKARDEMAEDEKGYQSELHSNIDDLNAKFVEQETLNRMIIEAPEHINAEGIEVYPQEY
jgi:hypothetical protein